MAQQLDQRMQPKTQPLMQPMLAGPQPMPQPADPVRKQGAGNGARLAKGVALAILPVALLGYAAIASGLVSISPGKLNLGLLFAAAAPSATAMKADADKADASKANSGSEEGDTLGRIGLTTNNLSPALAQSMGLATRQTSGVVILKVWPNTAAERGGLLTGDIMLAMDGVPIGDGTGMTAKIEYTPIGTTLNFIVERAGANQVVPVQVERWCTQQVKISDACSR
jgi:hypothetical protein